MVIKKIKKKENDMLLYMILLTTCFLSNSAIAMELVIEDSPTNQIRIRTLDSAHIIALQHQLDEWKNYSLSSRVIAQAIKKNRTGSNEIVNEAEIGIIKHIKKEDSEKYKLLVTDIYGLLRNFHPSQFDQECYALSAQYDQKAQDTQKKLESFNNWITHFDKYSSPEKNNLCTAVTVVFCALLILEAFPLIFTGAFSSGCWH
jgi:hypothetical protein